MRTTVFGGVAVLVVLVGVAIFSGLRSEVLAQGPGGTNAAGEGLIAFTTPISDKLQMLTVVDPRQQVVSVYHIDTHTGEIALKSVRNIRWDLQISEFNGVKPLPHEIRRMAEQSH